MSEFYVGQEVVCVDDAGYPWKPKIECYGDEIYPVKGAHYTIREFAAWPWPTPHADGCCRLVEITNQARPWVKREFLWEPCFGLRRFRPIKSESIQIFRDMCINAKRTIDA